MLFMKIQECIHKPIGLCICVCLVSIDSDDFITRDEMIYYNEFRHPEMDCQCCDYAYKLKLEWVSETTAFLHITWRFWDEEEIDQEGTTTHLIDINEEGIYNKNPKKDRILHGVINDVIEEGGICNIKGTNPTKKNIHKK